MTEALFNHTFLLRKYKWITQNEILYEDCKKYPSGMSSFIKPNVFTQENCICHTLITGK